MLRKIISFAAAVILTATYIPSAAAAASETEKVEISFKVGDSILSINGNSVEVETPYVAGEGTTLVPLRVITEAFGAEVDWENASQTVTIKYPDVNIELQIGNIVAKVNGHSEALAEAPVLSQNDVTMVPLRFISETFGANVSYDDATEAISVVKENVGGQTVTGVTDMAKTGDSYYNWSIDTPRQMQMTDRRADGLCTIFTADDQSMLEIDIFNRSEDELIPFDEEFSNVKDSFSGFTLTEAEKLTDKSGNKYMYFKVKNKNEMIIYREYYAPNNRTYEVKAMIKETGSKTEELLTALTDSFRIGKTDAQTYDLSTVENGFRIVNDDTYNVKFKVPADLVMADNEAENEIRFFGQDKNDNRSVYLGIFSKSADCTAQTLAEGDYKNNSSKINPEYITTSAPVKQEDGSYRYTQRISGSSANDTYMIDSFFEKGEYVYNMSVRVNASDDTAIAETILSSLEAEELDYSKVGKLLRNTPDDSVLTTNKVGDYSFKLPTSWKEVAAGSDQAMYMDIATGSLLSLTTARAANENVPSLAETARDLRRTASEEKKTDMLGNVEYENINGTQYARFKYRFTDEDGKLTYVTVYLKTDSKTLIMFNLYEHDVYYNKEGNTVFTEAIKSLTKN